MPTAVERMQQAVEDLLPALPTFDMPCEKKVTRYLAATEPTHNDPDPRGAWEIGLCDVQPTYILRPRNRRREPERRMYCRDHAIRAGHVWKPVTEDA
jgi:hypothetical protein